ncbi:hypothetical protein N7523_009645 [Penicillium sp. IBT 18751x]|nr:hypothetical protein N7523_009645 [Penicillium sp. IBT 18751x]
MGSTETRPKILLLGNINHAKGSWNALSDLGELIETTARNRAEFIQECRDGKFEGVVAAYRTFHSAQITGQIDEELVKELPSSLIYLASCGAGYDQIDVGDCSARKPPIRVSNVPTAVDDATADVNMFLILGALRNFNAGMHALRQGRWRGGASLGHDPEGKTLGILGMGGIGRNLKKKAETFGMKVIYHNRRQLSDELSDGAQYVPFDELLSTSDVLSLNLPLNVGAFHERAYS